MLIRVNEKMDKLLKKLEQRDLKTSEISALAIILADEVYKQWKEPKVITHEQKMEMQRGEVEDEWNN